MHYKNIFLSVLVILAGVVYGQEVLQKEDAVRIAMENNFGIKIAANNVSLAKNNASIQNSQKLPVVTSRAAANYSNTNGTVIFQDSGDKIDFYGNETKGLSASVGVQYMIFDGFGRSSTYKMLQNSLQVSELQARLILESTLLAVFNSYYEIAKLTQDVANQKQTLVVSRVRLERARISSDYGHGSQLNILNAEVDYNNDSITYLTNIQLLTQEKRNLNLLLGRDLNIDFMVDANLLYKDMLSLEELLQHSQDNNVSLLEQELLLKNAQYNVTKVRASSIPKLSVNAAYDLNENLLGATSFVERASSAGPSLGLSLSWNVFDGGATHVLNQNAKIQLDNQSINLERERLNIERNLSNAWTSYQTAMFVKDAHEKIVETANTNFNRSLDQYKLGQITNITFRQAQLDLLNAQLALNRAKYAAKNSELFLLQISGDLRNAQF